MLRLADRVAKCPSRNCDCQDLQTINVEASTMIVEHGEDREYSTGWLEFGFLPALSVVRMMPHVLRSRDDGFLPPFVVTHAHDGHVFYNVEESWVMS